MGGSRWGRASPPEALSPTLCALGAVTGRGGGFSAQGWRQRGRVGQPSTPQSQGSGRDQRQEAPLVAKCFLPWKMKGLLTT